MLNFSKIFIFMMVHSGDDASVLVGMYDLNVQVGFESFKPTDAGAARAVFACGGFIMGKRKAEASGW